MRRLVLPTACSLATPKPPPSAFLLHFPRTMSSETEPSSSAAPKKKTPDHPGCHRDLRRTFYIDAVVDKIMNKSLGHPFLMWTKTRAEWYRLLRSEAGCRALLRSKFLAQLRASMQEDEFEATKRFGSEKVCLARSFAEHKRIKRDLYHFKYRTLAEAAAADAAERGDLRLLGLGGGPATAADDWLEDSGIGEHATEPEVGSDAKDENAKVEGEKDKQT